MTGYLVTCEVDGGCVPVAFFADQREAEDLAEAIVVAHQRGETHPALERAPWPFRRRVGRLLATHWTRFEDGYPVMSYEVRDAEWGQMFAPEFAQLLPTCRKSRDEVGT